LTDITKLVKRLRIGGLVSETQVEAADALEAQVMETAQLAETLLQNHAVAQILLVDYRARILELEMETKKLRKAMRPISKWSFEAKDNTPAIKELHDDILRIRAALKEES